MSGPAIDRANSSGDIWTPWDFAHAVQRKFGPFTMDLAATAESAKAPVFITPERNSLTVDWAHVLSGGIGWLNPPYSNITPWATKCAGESARGAEILMLVPGSIGANWYWDWVEPYADVYSIGRLAFDNCYDRKTGKLVRDPYPKDLILCHYHYVDRTDPWTKPMERWRWQQQN